MPSDQLGELGELSPGDLHARLLGAGAQATGDRLAHLRVGALDREVVEQRDRLGADAHEIVDVHGHAVDPHGVVALARLGDDHLRADAVGADREPEVRGDLDHAGEVAREGHDPRGTPRVDRVEHTHERLHGAPGVAGVHAGPRVCVAHRRRFCRSRRITSAGQPGPVGRVGEKGAVALDLADEPGGSERRGEARGGARGEGDAGARRQPPSPQPPALERGGRGDDRQRDVAREDVRVLSPEAARAGGDEGGAVARHPGHERAGLGHAEPQRVRVARLLVAAPLRRAVHRHHRGRAEEQAGGDHRQGRPPAARWCARARRVTAAGGRSERTTIRTRRGSRSVSAPRTSPRSAISSAAAVPACSATSKVLRSSGSRSAYGQPASQGTRAMWPGARDRQQLRRPVEQAEGHGVADRQPALRPPGHRRRACPSTPAGGSGGRRCRPRSSRPPHSRRSGGCPSTRPSCRPPACR